jgi:hypothetical protein
MTWQGCRQLAIYAALITAVVKPLGGYTARIVDGNGNGRAPNPTDLQVLLAHRAAKPADPANAPPARNVTNHGDLSRITRNLSRRIGRLV